MQAFDEEQVFLVDLLVEENMKPPGSQYIGTGIHDKSQKQEAWIDTDQGREDITW
jgi:hypothetical protein